MRYLSSAAADIGAYYPIVIIGSGYGGAIAASRLSRAGQKVCLLERGREFQAGDFPNTLVEGTNEIQMHTGAKHVGSQTGLFDFHVHDGITVLVGCGLGGTSLINANVSMKPEDRVFEDECWPSQLRADFKDGESLLSKGYGLAKDMLKPAPVPDDVHLNKMETLKKSAETNGQDFYKLDINVNFDIDGKNEHGVDQKPCNLCGDCCSGCNNEAKNTLVMNYLPDAVNHGAEIFTQIEAAFIEKKGEQWHVHFSVVNAGAELFNAPTSYVLADMVIISAGTLGSTEIMLRSKEKGLEISEKLGQRFSGNGDVLGFGYNLDCEVDGVGMALKPVDTKTAPGPCITAIIDCRHQPVLNDGMIVEDAAIPGLLSPILSDSLFMDNIFSGSTERTHEKHSLIETLTHDARIVKSLFAGAHSGAMKNTQAYLLMTHDDQDGKMELTNDRLNINWENVGKKEIFQKADKLLSGETDALGGRYVRNPVWNKELHNEMVSVHPLGGCCMGENASTGVVNHKGQVFAPGSDAGVYHNLYITDGSVVPRSLGANPLFTISAISERCCALIAEDHGWTINYGETNEIVDPGKNKVAGVQFTETMKGYFSKEVTNGDYATGFSKGTANGESLSFTLTVDCDDVKKTISDPSHPGLITGIVSATGLSARPIAASNGIFNLFENDPDVVRSRLMKYQMNLLTEEGKSFFFKGFKRVHHDKGLDEWPDTSTLYITIFNGTDDSGAIVGQGILHIELADFQKQMRTMKVVNAASKEDALKTLADFGNYFAGSLFQVYGGVLVPDHYLKPESQPRKIRDLRLCVPEMYPLKTDDGIDVLLTRYKGGGKGPLLMVHGFSGNRYTYAIDTVDTNMTEYLYAQGYDIWLYDYRLSNLMTSSSNQHTLDEVARYDYPLAIEKIRSVTGSQTVDVMAHCVGSVTLFMALLSGMQGVRSVVSAQIAADFVPASQVQWKAGLHVPQLLDDLGIKSLTAYAVSTENWENKLFDKFLKLYAEPISQYCSNPACHRMTFMFGPLYEHPQLNDSTHRAMLDMFKVANIQTYEHLTKMIRAGHLLTFNDDDVYMQHFDKLKLPITFIHGAENKLFHPDSTLKTYTRLRETNGSDLYNRHVINDYGHNDCMYGKNAVQDVYPLILNQFEIFYK